MQEHAERPELRTDEMPEDWPDPEWDADGDPADLRNDTADVQDVRADVQDVPADVQDVPADVQGVPADVQDVHADVQDVHADVQDVRADVQDVPGEMQEAAWVEELQDAAVEIQHAEWPEEERPATGEPRVDAALARLDELAGRPVTEHRAVFEDVHRRLRDVLGELDSREQNPGDQPAAAGAEHRASR